MKVIAIATQKGGVGKTTSALEIASALTLEHNKKVLLIDFDQQGNLTKYVGVNWEDINQIETIYDALHDKNKTEHAIIKMEMFDFIPSTSELSKGDIEFSSADDVFLLDDALDGIKKDYDYIIIDNNPSRGRLMQMAYVAADYIIAPCDDTEGGSDGLLNVYTDIEKMKNARLPLSNAQIIGTLVTRFNGQAKLDQAVLKTLSSIMNEINPKGFTLPVRATVKMSSVKYARTSIQKFEYWANVAIDYRNIAKAIIKYEEEEINE